MHLRVVGNGHTCTASSGETVFGDIVANASRLKAFSSGDPRKKIVLDTDGQTTYRCLGGAIVRLQEEGFKIVAVTINGMKQPSP